MKHSYVILGSEPVAGTDLYTVKFSVGPAHEGLVTVPKLLLDTPGLDDMIQLQLSRRQDQLDQLAAGGE